MYKFIGLVGNMLRICWGYDGDIYAGCWLAYPLKNDELKVSWDDEIPNTPLPSVCIYPPSPSYISIECRNGGGEQVVKPGDGKRLKRGVKKVYTLSFLIE